MSAVVRNTKKESRIFKHTFSQFTDLVVLAEDGGANQHIHYLSFTGLPFEQVFKIAPDHEVTLGSFRIELVKAGTENTSKGALFAVRATAGKRIRLQANLSKDLFKGGARKQILESDHSTGITSFTVADAKP